MNAARSRTGALETRPSEASGVAGLFSADDAEGRECGGAAWGLAYDAVTPVAAQGRAQMPGRPMVGSALGMARNMGGYTNEDPYPRGGGR